jgi:hypothetical protein
MNQPKRNQKGVNVGWRERVKWRVELSVSSFESGKKEKVEVNGKDRQAIN